MFAEAELGHHLDKASYDRRLPDLRHALLDAQYRVLNAKRFAVVLVAHGEPACGRTEFVNLLNAWMDPRHIDVHALGRPSAEERARPEMWRYWTRLPPRGRIGIFLDSWYSDKLNARLRRDVGRHAFDAHLQRIKQFERMLIAEDHIVLKLWFHLPIDELQNRLDERAKDKMSAWRDTPEDRDFVKLFRKRPEIVEGMLRETATADAPWNVIDGHDRHWSAFQAGQTVLEALQARLAAPPPAAIPKPKLQRRPPPAPNVISALRARKRGRRLDAKEYEADLTAWQTRLARVLRRNAFRRHAVVAVFEGNDAAGKGGAIRRVSAAVDARLMTIVPIAAPSDEETARPYLWRFWRRVPQHGHVTIFDRSWYGRVLVERVEGFARVADWQRGYEEINEFEQEMTEAGIVLAKFFLSVSPAEQLKRFHERERTPWKQFKIGPDDWRNRAKRFAYDHAIIDMVRRTSTELAPWVIIEADDKLQARLKILSTLVKTIEKSL